MREFARKLAATAGARDSLRLALTEIKQPLNRRRALNFAKATGTGRRRTRVLVLLNGGIGNAVEATPLVQAIHMLWPDAEIDLCTPYGDLFKDWCLPSALLKEPDLASADRWDHTFIPWSSTLPEAIAEHERLGTLHTVPLLGAWFVKPEREYNLDTIRRLGYRGTSPPLYVSISAPDTWAPEHGMWVALVPGGQKDPRWHHKRWPYFSELIQALLPHGDRMHVCVLGGPDDPTIELPPGEERVIDMRGRWSLSETAWILKHMDAVVGNDCGPMHIADAVRAPSVTLFGPTCELKNGPLHGGSVLTTSIDCRPCQYVNSRFTCSDPRCLSDLSSERVFQTVAGMLPRSDSLRPLPATASP